jgi:hypothetical protein
MSSRRVKTSEDVINDLIDREFGGLSEDIKDIFEQIEKEEFEKRNKENEKYKNYSLNEYSNNSDKYKIKTNIYNTNAGRLNNLMNTDMIMKDIRELCKANQIKLSRIVNDKRVIYTKKELITKLKRKKII